MAKMPSPRLGDTIIQFIRTYVPQWAGAVIGFLVSIGIELPEGSEAQASALLIAVAQGAYYAVAVALSSKWPTLGWLLGYPAKPSYTEEDK